jgi:AraC-like DNA-binding protein
MERIRLTQQVIEYIIRGKPLDFADLNVNAIARHFKVSVPHLSRSFKAHQGTCLKKFLLKEKINRSRFLLIQDRRLTVKELAIALDFCSCDYFIRVFKKHVGITPGKFKKIYGGFYGMHDHRKGPLDRRSGIPDRRHRNPKNNVGLGLNLDLQNFYPKQNDRRGGSKDRRNGPPDRRKLRHHPINNKI